MTTVRLIGPGRAGRSLAAALADAGCDVRDVLGAPRRRGRRRRTGVDVLVIATPDSAIAEVAARGGARRPTPWSCTCRGRSGLDVLAPASPPGVAAPARAPALGRGRAGSGCAAGSPSPWPATPSAAELAALLDGSVVVVDDEHRAAYHAAACIASNHLVALMGQVERVAASAGLDLDTFVGLARAALTDVAELGPASALTGPAAPGATRPPSTATARPSTPPRSPATTPAWPWPGDWPPSAAPMPPLGPGAGTAAQHRRAPRRRPSPQCRRRHGTPAPPGPVHAGRAPRPGSSPTPSTPSGPWAAASASSPPWGPCTPGTGRSSSAPRRNATSWR